MLYSTQAPVHAQPCTPPVAACMPHQKSCHSGPYACLHGHMYLQYCGMYRVLATACGDPTVCRRLAAGRRLARVAGSTMRASMLSVRCACAWHASPALQPTSCSNPLHAATCQQASQHLEAATSAHICSHGCMHACMQLGGIQHALAHAWRLACSASYAACMQAYSYVPVITACMQHCLSHMHDACICLHHCHAVSHAVTCRC